MSGAGPNIGQGEGSSSSPIPEGGGGGDAGLAAHIHSNHAHPATAIFTDGEPEEILPAGNVEDAIDQLAGTIPPRPPTVGNYVEHLEFTGVPDWGVLKVSDSSLVHRGLLASNIPAIDIFPYYWFPGSPTIGDEVGGNIEELGADPQTDPTWNSGVNPVTLVGSGPGAAWAGAFTRPGDVFPPDPVIPTMQILDRDAAAVPRQVVLSGALYPADRGVVALLHWPPAGTLFDFLAQDLLDRCVCAILLGQGILGEGPCVEGECDGEPGGIFAISDDPFEYPGLASGQYDLNEIVNGIDSVIGNQLKPPWNDWDGDFVLGAKRFIDSPIPGPGQVRLGTDPNAGVAVKPYGIPIMGAQSPYSPAPGSGTLGDTVLDPANFFRYRLPYLSDYSDETGLIYTPGGVPGTEYTTLEKARYFKAAEPNSSGGALMLAQAGDYPDFPDNYYPWQLARYRQVFNLKSVAAPGLPDDLGTYLMVHFKTETDFETFVRDGIMPDDATDGYEVYSAYLVTGPSADPEDTGNRANEETSTTVPAPQGPAPAFGFAADSYHVVRASVFEDSSIAGVPIGDVTASRELVSGSVPGPVSEHVMWCSGVAFFVPKDPIGGAPSLQLTNVDATVVNFWEYSYRTDFRFLSGALGSVPPALISSMNPAFMGVSPFAWEAVPGVPTGVPGAGFTPSGLFVIPQRVEIPYTHCGSNGSGFFSPTNGPMHSDVLTVNGTVAGPISPLGDPTQPAFTSDGQIRLYLRVPLGHTGATRATQPFSFADGHGAIFTEVGGFTTLYHSTSFDATNLIGEYGNFLPATPGPVFPPLITLTKDGYEPFLDEVYRYLTFTIHIDSVYGSGARATMIGPGMQGWMGGPIETPIHIGTTPGIVWWHSSWMQNGFHKTDLSSGPFLQVSGLPDRNPPISNGVRYQMPSAGVLMYPQKDYSAGYRPATGIDILDPQPDYTSLSFTEVREYYRVLDASLNQTVDAAGQPFVTLRIDGLELQEFVYSAPGPGALADTGIALSVKVPGLTTWMDIGRPDGSGPSKQDAVLDGAGCQIVGPNTFDGVDEDTGLVYSQVRINVGPSVNLFAMTGIENSEVDLVPVVIRVQMAQAAAAYNLEREYDPVTKTFSGAPSPGLAGSLVRGLVGIRVVDPTA
jgi:hypothetical protein